MERHMTKYSTFEKTMQPNWKRINLHAKCTNMAKMHQPAFFYIWPNDVDECMLVRFPMLVRIGMLIRFSHSPMPHLKGGTYGEGECPSILPYGIP